MRNNNPVIQIDDDIFELKQDRILNHVSSLKKFYFELSSYEKFFKIVKDNSFIDFKYLEELHIDFISENIHFDKNAFNGLTNLKKLILDVDMVYSKYLNYEHMPYLETLCINNAEFNNDMESYNFNMMNLKSLILKESTLEINPGFFQSFQNLENICIKNCNLSILDESCFSNLNNITSVNIVNTNFGDNFDLFNNLLKQMPFLRRLKINSKDFIVICAHESLMSKLEELVLVKSNKIFEIQSKSLNDLFNLENFKFLKNLKRIKLSFLDDTNHLELSQNFLSFLGNNYKSIDYIKISYLEKVEFIENAFSNFINLKFLRLSSCNINHLDHIIFDGLISLEVLNLESNKISSLDQNVFSDLINLKSLNLSKNNIKDIDSNCFRAFNQKLEYLNLSGNSNLQFNEKDIDEFKKLHNLNDSVEIIYEKKIEILRIDFSKYHNIFFVP